MKPRLSYSAVFGSPAPDKWLERFNEIHEGQRIIVEGRTYRVKQKNDEPAWLYLKAVRKPREEVMLRQGDPRLLEDWKS